mmetsp:Transcript_106231/g.298749  ORF Transcript_106231/g.298749 Transcript_106231/m.298749 type:complete len:282 (+) Transcript_106231:1161-2006(+)
MHGVGEGQLRKEDVLLRRIVEDLGLRTFRGLHQVVQLLLRRCRLPVGAFDVRAQDHALHLELPADGRVTDGRRASLCEVEARHVRDFQPCVGHRTEEHLVVADLAVRPVLIDDNEAHEQVPPRDLHVGDSHAAIVHTIVTKLLTDVAELDARQRLVSVPIADLEKEGMWPVVFAFDNDAGHEDAAVAALRKATRPPLHRLQRRGVDVPTAILEKRLVVHRCCLNAAHVRAVSKLRLRVGAQDVVVESLLEPPTLLLVVCEVHQRRSEHDVVQEDEKVLTKK